MIKADIVNRVAEESELPRVKAALHRNNPDSTFHIGIGDLDDSRTDIVWSHAQLVGEYLDSLRRALGVELHLSSQKPAGM